MKDPDDYDDETGPSHDFRPRKYEAFTGNPELSQRFVGALQQVVTRRWPPNRFRTWRLNRIMPRIINQFVDLDRTEKFWDEGWKLLPMDNQIDERLMPLEFTEMKIPLSRTMEVINALNEHFLRYRVLATGTFGLEIYPCKRSDFWLSPAYGTDDFLKIDVIWFRNRTSDPVTTFYPQYWELLKQFDFRLHWGKFLPAPSQAWRHYIHSQYPKWTDWRAIRDEFDPDRVFVTDYWARHLGI